MIYPAIFLISLVLTLILIPLVKNLSLRFDLYDDPGNDSLKIHKKPISFLGGAALILSFLGALFFAWIFSKYNLLALQTHSLLALAIGSVVAWLYGFWDDSHWQKRINMGQKSKIYLQIPIALALASLFYLAQIQWQFIPIPFLGVLVSAFYFLVIMNAVNVQDGLDGLAGGLVFISSVGFLLLSIANSSTLGLVASFSLAGVTLAYLFFNWHPASIFMANNGSYFLGFLMAFFAILPTKPGNFAWLVAPLFIVGMPLFNTAYVFSRRALNHQPLFAADRHHFYDKLHQIFGSVPKSVAVNYLIQIIFVAIGLAIAANY